MRDSSSFSHAIITSKDSSFAQCCRRLLRRWTDPLAGKDLKRFREYEASTARIYNAPVITYVICSSRVKELRNSITEGTNTYRVNLLRLKDEDADELLAQLTADPDRTLTREDIIPLLFSPVRSVTAG